MEPRVVLASVAAAGTLFLGAWARAEWVLADRVRQVALDGHQACSAGRGMGAAAPTAEEIAGHFRALAEEHSLTAHDVSVRMEPLRPGEGGVMGGVVAQLGGITGGALKMTGTQITVDGRVHGKKWLWSTDKPIQATCLQQGKVERVLPERSFGE